MKIDSIRGMKYQKDFLERRLGVNLIVVIWYLLVADFHIRGNKRLKLVYPSFGYNEMSNFNLADTISFG